MFDNDTWTKDTFLTGATWRDTVFQDIETGEEEDGRKFAGELVDAGCNYWL